MDKKQLQKFFNEQIPIKLNIKNGRFFSGVIIELNEDSLVFRDKFNDELPFSLDSIAYIQIINQEDNSE